MPLDVNGLATVALVGRHELDAAVAVPVVVPIHERRYPQACLFHAGEWPPWLIGPVFCCAEQRCGAGVVVANPWSGEGPQHSQLFQQAFQRGGTQLFEKPAARHCRYRRGGSAAAGGSC